MKCSSCQNNDAELQIVCEFCGHREAAPYEGSLRRLARRVSDGKVLPVVDEQGDEICVEELFPFVDGGPSPSPLRLWHKRSLYVFANTEITGAERPVD